MTLIETPTSSNDDLLDMEWTVPPGQRRAAADHYHPAHSQRGELDDRGEMPNSRQWVLTIHDLLLSGSFLAGLPRWV